MLKKWTCMGNSSCLSSLCLQKLCFASAVLVHKFKCIYNLQIQMLLQFGENALIYWIKDRYLILILLQWQLLYGFHWQWL